MKLQLINCEKKHKKLGKFVVSWKNSVHGKT